MPEFIIRALAAGTGVALVAGPLGCFIVWRRMAYFGDTLSHAGLTGIALGLVLGISPVLGMVATGLTIGGALVLLQGQRRLAADTLLGILSHGALAAGLIAVSFLDRVRVDLLGYLFGDILAVSGADLLWIYAGAAAVLTVLALLWRGLVAMTVHEEMAAAEGVAVGLLRFVFTALIALTIAIAMKVVGVLLVTAMLVVPAATARQFARGPEIMAIGAGVSGVLAVFMGVLSSLAFDLPSGPAIVAAAVILFAVATSAGLLRPRGWA